MTTQARSLYDDLITLNWYFSDRCCTGSDFDCLSMVDFLALRLIHQRHHCPIQTISKALCMTKSGATRVVKRLEKQHLITITTSSDDARVRCLSLTEKGNKAVSNVIQTQTQHLQALLESIGDEKSQQLTSGIKALMTTLKP